MKGVAASEQMAQTDLERMTKYTDIIKTAGEKYDVDPALIAGIISRESRAGNQLKNGYGDGGRAWGLMQVDSNAADSVVFSPSDVVDLVSAG